jgi:hypothetical protein
MEMSRGLLAILALLALGLCWDVAIIVEGGSALGVVLALLAGRIAAMVGILMRSRVGWLLAIGFFVAIIALNVVALGQMGGVAIFISILLPVLCLVYLVAVRAEFE